MKTAWLNAILTLSILGCGDPATPVGPDGDLSTDTGTTFGPDTGSGLDAAPIPGSDGGPVQGLDSGAASLPFTGCTGSAPAYAVFNSFWSELDQHYAVFDLRLPSRTWDDVGHESCARMSESITASALFDVILSMGQALDDGHINLTADDIGREEDAWVTGYAHSDIVEDLEGNIENQYIDGDFSWANDDWFAWGRAGNIGYISLTSFDELSDSGDEEDDVAAARSGMDMIMSDLGSVSGMIVDVRANGGGWDDVALAVAQYFAGPRALTWSKARRNGPEPSHFGPFEDVYVEAATSNAYTGPVVLLTSGYTFSAAETFTLAMRVRSNVTILGERTSGHFSDLEDGSLPNGWEYTYSAERYRAADGNFYEAQGVPVDVELLFDRTAFGGGTDNHFEAARSRLGG